MRKRVALALIMALAAGVALAQEGEAKKKRVKPQRAKREMTEKQKQQRIKGWEGTLARRQRELARLEKSAAGVADEATRKEAEAAMAKLRTVTAACESALGSAKQGDFEEATRVSLEVRSSRVVLNDQLAALNIKIEIDQFTQLAAKSQAKPEVAAACQKVVELCRKKLELQTQTVELRSQMNGLNREIAAARRATVVRPARKPRADKAARQRKAGRKKDRAKKAAGAAIE